MTITPTYVVKVIDSETGEKISEVDEGTVDQNGNVVFENPDGFSTFEITEDNPATVEATGKGFLSLQEAVDYGLVQ